MIEMSVAEFLSALGTTVTTITYDTTQAEGVILSADGLTANVYNVQLTNEGTFTTGSYMPSTLVNVNLKGLDVSQREDFSNFFYNLSSLASLDISNWDTSNATNMNQMFAMSSIKTLDLSNFDVSKVTNMNAMFAACKSLQSINLLNWSTDSLTNISAMFASCTSLETLDLSHFNVSNVTNFNSFLGGASNLKTFNASGWSFNDSVTNLVALFATGLSSLQNINLSNWDLNKVTAITALVNGCSSLTSINFSGWNTSNITDMQSVFTNCSSLTTLDLTSWNTKKVTKMNCMFQNCTSLTSIVVGTTGWDTSSATTTDMFSNCPATFTYISDLEDILKTEMTVAEFLSAIKASPIAKYITYDNTQNEGICYSEDGETINVYNVILTEGSFGSSPDAHFPSSLINIDLRGLDVSNLTSAYGMFYNCSALETLNVSNWDMKTNTTLYAMFYRCTSLTELDLSSWKNTNGILDMGSMFCGCTSIRTVNLNNLDFSSNQYLHQCFQGCSSLEELKIENTNFTGVTDINQCFQGCSSLKYFSFEGALFNELTCCSEMFSGCINLKEVNLSSWDKVSYTISMFNGCTSLETVNLSNWDLRNSSTSYGSEYNGCVSLKKIIMQNLKIYDNCRLVTDYQHGISNTNISNLEIDCSGWEIYINNGSFSYLFGSTDAPCISSLDVSNWKFYGSLKLNYLFYNFKTLVSLKGLETWDTSNIVETDDMFSNCYLLNEDLQDGVKNFNMSALQSCEWMFAYCTSLTKIDISNWNTSSAMTCPRDLFTSCTSLEEANISNFNFTNVSSSNCCYIFDDCTNLKKLIINNIVIGSNSLGSSTTGGGMLFYYMTDGYNSPVQEIEALNWYLTNPCSFYEMCAQMPNLKKVQFSINPNSLGYIISMYGTFLNCGNLEEIYFSDFPTDKVTSFTDCFEGCYNLKYADLSSFTTTQATDLNYMFEYVGKNGQATIKIKSSKWNASQLLNSGGTFEGTNLKFIEEKENSTITAPDFKTNSGNSLYDIDERTKNISFSASKGTLTITFGSKTWKL